MDDVSLEVHAGEIVGILGPSGSGKSSLLRLLNRLDEPTSGTVFLEDTDYRNVAPRQLRRTVGMVMQRPYLFPGIVAGNVLFGPQQRAEPMTDGKVSELLGEVGLSGYEHREVSKLSGGEAQRVSLARALANSPRALLLDEPTSALDDASKSGIESLVMKIVEHKHLACLLVTHDRPQTERVADRILHMDRGRVSEQKP